MSIQDVVDKILEENPLFRNNYTFQLAVKDIYEKYKVLYKTSEVVDKVDRIIGPIEAVLRAMGPGVGYLSCSLLRVGEELFLKIPFATYYAAKTKNFTQVGLWAGMELLATLLPFGDLIDIYPAYRKGTERLIEREIRKRVER